MGGGQSSPEVEKKSLNADGSSENLKKDLKKWQDTMNDMEKKFQELCQEHPGVTRILEASKGLMKRPVKDFVNELVDHARPPVIYLLGRSGHGKSSLINALAKQSVTEVGHEGLATASSNVYDINFEGKGCTWKVIESRGIFETNRAGGAKNLPATDQVKIDIKTHKPDIILHVVCCTEARKLKTDLLYLKEMFKTIEQGFDFPPVVVVLTKADVIGHTQQWPPCDYPAKQKILEELLSEMGKRVLLAGECKALNPNADYCGLELDGCKPFLYIIPVATVTEEPVVRWHIDELSLVIGNVIPCQAWLYFYQGQEHKGKLKDLTAKVIEKFSAMATGMFYFDILS